MAIKEGGQDRLTFCVFVALVDHRLMGTGFAFILLNSALYPPSVRMHLPSQNPLLKDRQVGYSGHTKVFWLKEHNAV